MVTTQRFATKLLTEFETEDWRSMVQTTTQRFVKKLFPNFEIEDWRSTPTSFRSTPWQKMKKMHSFNFLIDQIGTSLSFLNSIRFKNMLNVVPIRPITQVKTPNSIILPTLQFSSKHTLFHWNSQQYKWAYIQHTYQNIFNWKINTNQTSSWIQNTHHASYYMYPHHVFNMYITKMEKNQHANL